MTTGTILVLFPAYYPPNLLRIRREPKEARIESNDFILTAVRSVHLLAL